MKLNKERIKEFVVLFLNHGLIICLGLALLVQCEENRIISEDSNNKDEYIDKLKERDSLYRVYMGARDDGSFIYRHIGDSIISYKSLLDETNKLELELSEAKKRNRELEDSLWVKSSVIKMLNEDINFSYRVKIEGGKLIVHLSLME